MRKPSRLLHAALSLPGVLATAPALAEEPPADALLGVRYAYYHDSQPSLDRIHVNSPSLYLLLPFAGQWSVEGTAVYDSVSGASPRYHSAVSSASKSSDQRKAADLNLTRYFGSGAVSLGAAYSTEHDYRSAALNAGARYSLPGNNTTFNAGVGITRDRIQDVDGLVLSINNGKAEKKNTNELLVGVTQVLTSDDIVQLNASYAMGKGYYSDPYKSADNRPRTRNQTTVLARWNHDFGVIHATLRSHYRFYTDTWNIQAHTAGIEWVQSLGAGWTVVPSARYYTQNAAEFYFDPVYDPTFGAPFPPGFAQPGGPVYYSADQRLSAFGAITVGLKVVKQITPSWTVDVKAEVYQQRSEWRIGGEGSPGLESFRAEQVQVGATTKF